MNNLLITFYLSCQNNNYHYISSNIIDIIQQYMILNSFIRKKDEMSYLTNLSECRLNFGDIVLVRATDCLDCEIDHYIFFKCQFHLLETKNNNSVLLIPLDFSIYIQDPIHFFLLAWRFPIGGKANRKSISSLKIELDPLYHKSIIPITTSLDTKITAEIWILRVYKNDNDNDDDEKFEYKIRYETNSNYILPKEEIKIFEKKKKEIKIFEKK